MKLNNSFPILIGVFLGIYTLLSFSYGFWLVFSGVTLGVIMMYSGGVLSMVYTLAIVVIPLLKPIENKVRLNYFRISIGCIPASFIVTHLLFTIIDNLFT